MANQVIVSNTGNVQVQISRVAVGTLSNVATSNYSNYAGNLINGNSSVDIVGIDSNVTITTSGTENWTFDVTGNTTLPGNMLISGSIIPSSNISFITPSKR